MAESRVVRSMTCSNGPDYLCVSVTERRWPHWPAEPSTCALIHREYLPLDHGPDWLQQQLAALVKRHMLP